MRDVRLSGQEHATLMAALVALGSGATAQLAQRAGVGTGAVMRAAAHEPVYRLSARALLAACRDLLGEEVRAAA